MPLDSFKNLAEFTLSLGYDASATSIVLTADPGAACPTAPANAWWYNATDFPNPKDDPNYEIVRMTARAGATLTITRAQEGTAASTKNTASKTYKLCFGLTAKTLNTDLPAEFTARDASISAAQADAAAALADLAAATGTGDPVRENSPTIVTPTIASMANANHNHQNAAGGGQLTEAALNLADNTTNDASTARHGFLKKLSNNAAEFMNGQGNWATPAGGASSPLTTKYKTADQSIASSTTLTDITDLTCAISANKKYRFRAVLFFTQAGSSANLKLSVNGPAAPNYVIFSTAIERSSSSVQNNGHATSYGTAQTAAMGAVSLKAFVEGYLDNGANAGTLAMQFAQNVSDANNTTIVKGSALEVTELT